jgi:hypothetical protein
VFLLWAAGSACAAPAPDEDKLGKPLGYPVGTAKNWFYDESVRVGSFTAQGEIPGIFGGKANVLPASSAPMPLPRLEREPPIRWILDRRWKLGIDDYLARQRIMGLLIIKDGVIQVERYQYDRNAQQRFVSNSMAKSLVSLAVGIAQGEGRSPRSTTAPTNTRRDWLAPCTARPQSATCCACPRVPTSRNVMTARTTWSALRAR